MDEFLARAANRELTFTPHVTPASRALVGDSRLPVEDRLLAQGKASDAFKASLAAEAAAARAHAEEASVRRPPPPTANGGVDSLDMREAGDVIDRNEQWMLNKQRRAEDMRSRREQEELSEVRSTPAINSRSAALAGPRSGREVSEALYADAARQREDREARARESLANEMVAYPAITKKAAQLVRSEDISDRLYSHARDLERRRKEMAEKHEREAATGAGRRLHSSRRHRRRGSDPGMYGSGYASLASPSGGAGGQSSAQRSMGIGDRLYARALKQRERLKQTIEAEVQARTASAKPALNKRSLKIAKSLRRKDHMVLVPPPPAPITTKAGDTTAGGAPGAGGLAAAAPASPMGFGSSSPSSRTPIKSGGGGFGIGAGRGDSTGRGRARGGGGGGGRRPQNRARSVSPQSTSSAATRTRSERLYREGTVRVARRRVAKNTFEDRELEACTFAPDIGQSRDLAPETRESIYQRGRTWVAKREVKLLRKRVARVGDELTDCTFEPEQVAKPLRSARRHARSRSVSSIEELHPSVSDFLARQRRGRELAKEKNNPRFLDGSKWTGRTTQPKEFKFAHRQAKVRVKALRKPVGSGSVTGPDDRAAAPADSGSSPSPGTPQMSPVRRVAPQPHPHPGYSRASDSGSATVSVGHRAARPPPPAGLHIRDMYAADVTRALQAAGDLSPSASSPFNRRTS